jgi:hypothetical protein
MPPFTDDVNLLSKIFNPSEMLVYIYIKNLNKNNINLKNLINIFNKNKLIEILKNLAQRKIIFGCINEDYLELEKIEEPKFILENHILESKIKEPGHRPAPASERIIDSSDIRNLFYKNIEEDEQHIARKLIRKIIAVCSELKVTEKQLFHFLKDEIGKGKYWKEILSLYNIRRKFDKDFSKELE